MGIFIYVGFGLFYILGYHGDDDLSFWDGCLAIMIWPVEVFKILRKTLYQLDNIQARIEHESKKLDRMEEANDKSKESNG